MIPEFQVKRDAQMQKICQQAQNLFHEKNIQYGDAIRQFGLYGSVMELVGATIRLQNLLRHSMVSGQSIVGMEDSIKDILLDLHNYAAIGLMMIDDKNYFGVWEAEE